MAAFVCLPGAQPRGTPQRNHVKPPVCTAASRRAVDEPVPDLGLLATAVNSALQIKPLFSRAQRSAMEMMQARGKLIGVDWTEHKAYISSLCPEKHMERIARDDTLANFPPYYEVPFHAYENGNRCWAAAMEADVASLSVHSTLFDEETPNLMADEQLRINFCNVMGSYLDDEADQVRCIIDVGASTGRSTRGLLRTFPYADIIALDASEYMLAVASVQLGQDDELKERVQFVHAAAEDMPRVLQRNDVDAVVLSLVAHELPRGATGQILSAAYQVMQEDAMLAILEIDPDAPAVGRLLRNPFFRGLFRCTEPYLDDYLSLDLKRAITEAGFVFVAKHAVSTRHAALIAYKPSTS